MDAYRGVVIGIYTILFPNIAYTHIEKDESLSIVFVGGGFLTLKGSDAICFQSAIRGYLGIMDELDSDEEVPF
jgi:hypothetical protein